PAAGGDLSIANSVFGCQRSCYTGCMTNQQTGPVERRRSRGERDPRAAIVAAAYRVLAEQAYEPTTIQQIARVAGVAPGLVHYYFDSKEQLLGEVLQLCAARARELSSS